MNTRPATHARTRAPKCRNIVTIYFYSLFFAASVGAQNYPSKPVRILVGYPPGAGSDIVTRLITPELSKTFGQ
jgi:tripartite-type tricarboxylate transporter receptor subunit TctC